MDHIGVTVNGRERPLRGAGAHTTALDWLRDNGPWLDINYASSALYNGSMTGEQWAQLGVTTLVWLWIPLAIGLRAVLRAEVK